MKKNLENNLETILNKVNNLLIYPEDSSIY